jgi:chaperonin cofactor prefoldin
MAVMAREAWTDERLDDLKENVNQRFDQVDKRFDEVDKRFDRVEADIRELRLDVKRVDGKVDVLQSEMNGRFDSMQQTMVIGFVTLFTGIVASIIAAILAG